MSLGLCLAAAGRPGSLLSTIWSGGSGHTARTEINKVDNVFNFDHPIVNHIMPPISWPDAAAILVLEVGSRSPHPPCAVMKNDIFVLVC